jgi:hypothetical protein
MMHAGADGDSWRQGRPEAPASGRQDQVPPDLEPLRAAVERSRGAPLILVPTVMPEDRRAMWIGAAGRDYILYERSLAPSRRAWEVARQAGHMLAGHRGAPAGGDAATALFPALDRAVVAAELPAPAEFTPAEVGEAEALATALLARLALPPGRGRQPPGRPWPTAASDFA